MRVLITGGSGMLGATLAPYLLKKGFKVTIYDTRFNKLNIPTIIGDVNDSIQLRDAMKNQDIVVHAASLHGPHIGYYEDQDFINVNVAGTFNLLREATKLNIKKVINISSTSVFGISKKRNDISKTVLINEDTKPCPLDINDLTKYQVEILSRYFKKKYGLNCICLRLGRFFEDEDYLTYNLRKLYGAVDVRDVSHSIYKTIIHDTSSEDTLCISSKTNFRAEDLSKLSTNPKEVLIKYYPEVEEVFEYNSIPFPEKIHRVVNIEKAEKLIGYSPQYNFKEFLDEISPIKKGVAK